MKISQIIALILLTHLAAHAQEQLTPKNDQTGVTIRSANPGPTHISPLCVIKAENKKLVIPSAPTSLSYSLTLDELNADWIQTVTVLRDKEATDKYGTLGQHGVIIIGLKEGSLEKMPLDLVERFVAD